ncbi:hypothetical protein [Tenacibaculum ovolyticum]|uniref:hypothetical protein n=1 Tax=Tenacibaculum ovolyticum TaxID=104270 RepID=UPI0003FDDC9B|nr:hypothetical protein [Tenacibaculum ovolyticum]
MENKVILNKETDSEVTFRSFSEGRVHLEVSKYTENIRHIMLTEEQSKEVLSFLEDKNKSDMKGKNELTKELWKEISSDKSIRITKYQFSVIVERTWKEAIEYKNKKQ